MLIKKFLNSVDQKNEVPKNNMKNKKSKSVERLLTDLLIIELSKSKIAQPDIQKILGIDMNRISHIARYFKSRRK